MKFLDMLQRALLRFRYPASLPEDIAQAFGISLPNSLSFDQFIGQLLNPHFVPKKLFKYMPRDKAEAAFQGALKKERFLNNTLFSYYFTEGWMEFMLIFDDASRLRRIYVRHKKIKDDAGQEIRLHSANHRGTENTD